MPRTFALTLLLVALVAGTARAADKPNIVVILADDLGYTDIGVQGGKDIPTPHIDSIAKGGIRFSRGYVSAPYCSPTRAGLMTGRYQERFGHEFNEGKGRLPFGLPLTETTLAQRMKALGYATAVVGKWHLGPDPDWRPMKRGFDEFYGTLSNTPFRQPQLVDSRIGPDPKKVEDPNYYTTVAYADRAVDIIDKNKDRPFFLYLPFNACHVPDQALDEKLARFKSIKDEKRRLYAGMMSSLDDAVGRVLGKLRAEKLEEKTLIVFLSDNGGPMTRMGPNGSQNGFLRGQKGDTWDGGIHVPFFMKWKGHLPAGKTFPHPVIQLDILPTAIAAAGGEVAADWKLDGVNLLPHLMGKDQKAPHERLYWRFGSQWAVMEGNWKLVQAYDDNADQKGLATGEVKVEPAQLFDLKADRGEKKDLSAKRADKVKALEAAWKAWNADLPEPAWLPQAKKT